ncbi:MAG: ABC transporter permease [Sphingomonas sp.]|uniref:ABC transporter permease n=1 Tax=Sphingomonas sp. TaxID=28214 RepID=UPI0025EB8B3B|nr:ABC transporter permease [Sphingomonas sp.]MBX3566241.1 ABC transporter permease [Sphingomonas sp.]
MSKFARALRQTFTVVRRDFTATVFTPTFLLFLLAPLIFLSFSVMGSLGASQIVDSSGDKLRMVVIAPPAQSADLLALDKQLRGLFPRGSELMPPPLTIVTPEADTARQARDMFDSDEYDAAAVLHGPLNKPEILYVANGWSEGQYLAQLAEQVLRAERAGGAAPLSTATRTEVTRGQASFTGKGQVASAGVFGIFFLTLFLSGQAVGTMAEERSNKVIEILAAAVPLESVFFGKLLAMFAVAVLFVAFWATLIVNGAKLLPDGAMRLFADAAPAVGPVAFPLLFAAYFTMAYLLLGAVFLSLGAQTSTQRELQMLSLPITFFQMAMFGLALAATSRPGTWLAFAVELFPFSSPYAMIGHAGNSPLIWPHLAALGWQALWVAITVTIGARLFRRGVLKSGSPPFWRRRPAAIDTPVN